MLLGKEQARVGGNPILAYLRRKTDMLLILLVATVYLIGYGIYTRDVDYSLPAYDACIDSKPSPSPFATKFTEMEAVHPASDKLIAAINALPDLPASGGLPTLHYMMKMDKEAGNDDLFDTVTYVSQHHFEDLMRADDILRNKVRDILFIWAGVDNADPNNRGPFIDARELQFLEKMKDEPFLQDGLYPNPAPLDAGRLRTEFYEAWNGYYAQILRQLLAKDLYAAQPVAEGTALSASGLDKLSRHANDFASPEQKAAYWTNVVRMVEPAGILLSGFAASPNGLALDKAIRVSAPTLSLEAILARAHQSPAFKGERYTDRAGRPIGFSVSYLPQKVRVVCYGFTDTPAASASRGQ